MRTNWMRTNLNLRLLALSLLVSGCASASANADLMSLFDCSHGDCVVQHSETGESCVFEFCIQGGAVVVCKRDGQWRAVLDPGSKICR